MENNSKSNLSTIILVALLLSAVLGGGYFWNQSETLSSEKDEMSDEYKDEIDVLTEERNELIVELEVLESSYQEILESNDSLEIAFKNTTKSIERKNSEINKIKNDFSSTSTGMKAEIAQLQKIKTDLTGLVAQLQKENSELKSSNSDLALQVSDVAAANKELAFEISEMRQLNAELERERTNLMASSARTNNLRIDIKKTSEKTTTSARRAKEIVVSFNLAKLPENRRGMHNLYVVIKDVNGIPVKVDNPVKATIRPNGEQSQEIIAQQMVNMDLTEESRYQFKIFPQTKSLHKGFYRVVVYADWGLLGGAQFQLK